MEHEERPKVLNELGKKIQLLMKAVEAYKNKVEVNYLGNELLWAFEFLCSVFCIKKKSHMAAC